MKKTITMASTLLAAGVSMAQVVNFDKDKDKAGVAPADWLRRSEVQADPWS